MSLMPSANVMMKTKWKAVLFQSITDRGLFQLGPTKNDTKYEQKYSYDQTKLSIVPKMSRRQKMEMRKSLEVRSKGERGFNKIY